MGGGLGGLMVGGVNRQRGAYLSFLPKGFEEEEEEEEEEKPDKYTQRQTNTDKDRGG